LADENRRFVEEFANPHSWLMMADNLHEQATEIYGGRGRSTIITKVNANNEILQQTLGIDKSVFLLGGFALENAIKAFLVYENPSWVSNGRLSGKLRSHSLSALQQQSQLIPYKKRYINVLRAFESGLDSWFRYPCALTIQDTKEEDACSTICGRAIAKSCGRTERNSKRCLTMAGMGAGRSKDGHWATGCHFQHLTAWSNTTRNTRQSKGHCLSDFGQP
jgi:hypothetical protein